MELGKRLTKYRKEADLTLDELAERSGVPKGTINKIISGDTKSPSLDTVSALAAALGKTLNDFADAPEARKSTLSEIDKALLDLFHSLNEEGQEEIIKYADTLCASGKYHIKNHQFNVG